MGGYPVQAVQSGDEVQLQAVSGKGYPLTVVATIGRDPLLCCACGASLVLNYFLDNGGISVMTKRLSVFIDAHEGCEAS